MKITKEMLQTVSQRGENLNDREDNILIICLRDAINGFDVSRFRYDDSSHEEVMEMEQVAEELINDHGFDVYFDGDEGQMFMIVRWGR